MRKFLQMLALGGSLTAVYAVSLFADVFYGWLEHSPEHELALIFSVIATIFILSFIVFYASSNTPLPSFVVAIFFGVAGHNFLKPILEHEAIVAVLVGLGATLILFGGGIETPYKNFKKLFWKICSLSFPGLLLTAFCFSLSVYGLSNVMNVGISIPVAVLLGAILASTDPAAIIPVLKVLRFKNRDTKDIIVSESAVTDVTGTLVTVAFMTMLAAGSFSPSITGWYKNIFSLDSGMLLGKQILFGVFFGILGYYFLELLQKFKHRHAQEFEVDSAFFLFVPIIIFTITLSFGGSGYLAAFIAGLLFHVSEHLHDTERFFNHIIDGFFKPTIFLLLGAIVDVKELIHYAPIGILISLVFMLIIRPLTVFIFLYPFSFFGTGRLNLREVLFVAAVRETGAIPAVLLVTVAAAGFSGMEGLVPIGMWVILMTLIIEPALTPFIAQKLGVAELMTDEKKTPITTTRPVVILGTRGYSFLQRLEKTADWSERHGVKNITVLLCPEDNYSSDLVTEVKKAAEPVFDRINNSLTAAGKPAIEFSFISRKGFLQNNISELANSDLNVSAIFIGRKMLDYRSHEIKNLNAPLYFIE